MLRSRVSRQMVIVTLAALYLVGLSCSSGDDGTGPGDGGSDIDYRAEMRLFVQAISSYAKGINPSFVVIPQNGLELLTLDTDGVGDPATAYTAAIDAVGREDLFYGYDDDNVATPTATTDELIEYLDLARAQNLVVLTTDYCWTQQFVDDSYARNAAHGYLSFAADHRELDNVPSYPSNPLNVNSALVTNLAIAKNFLYLINPDSFASRTAYLNAIKATNYDLMIIDLFQGDNQQLTPAEVSSLKQKANGGTRLVIAYMSIGEAENYRYYWNPAWNSSPPSWLGQPNPDWPDNFKVHYWDDAWQSVITGSPDSYVGRVLSAGFDGVYLDIIDAFEYFEEN